MAYFLQKPNKKNILQKTIQKFIKNVYNNTVISKIQISKKL